MVKAPEELDAGTGERERAGQRVERKRRLHGDFVTYLVINGILIVACMGGGTRDGDLYVPSAPDNGQQDF